MSTTFLTTVWALSFARSNTGGCRRRIRVLAPQQVSTDQLAGHDARCEFVTPFVPVAIRLEVKGAAAASRPVSEARQQIDHRHSETICDLLHHALRPVDLQSRRRTWSRTRELGKSFIGYLHFEG